MSADEIFIRDLVIETLIGVLPHERITPQPVELDISLKTSIEVAARSEDLVDTLDYAAIAAGLASYVQSTHFQLIETLAEAIVQWLWVFSPAIDHVHLELRKPKALPQAKTVGLKIARNRSLTSA